MEESKYVTSILNRKFSYSDKKLTTFNSQFQGSVAHAMQAVLIKIFNVYRENILTEMHDSIIMCCDADILKEMVNKVSKIMLNPLDNILNEPLSMPLTVSIGRHWKKWRLAKTVRSIP
jgi:DNA polymerase I-like protein with 3'-5' exonuclease and polymerase domains